MEQLTTKLTALEEELRNRSNALQAALLKNSRLEENHQSEIDQLNADLNHFRTLYEDTTKVFKSQEK